MGGADSALASQIEPATRRRTTVLFARVSGNQSPNVAELSPRRHCVEALVQAAELSGGRVMRTQRDAVMALFRSPDAAAAAAVRMHAYAEKLTSLHVRIGLEAGMVQQDGRDVLGDTVNLALEFSSQALGGQIITSTETASKLSSTVQAAVKPLASAGKSAMREVAWRESASRILAAQKSTSTVEYALIRMCYREKVLVRRRDWDIVTMGRDPGAHFVVADETASRQHCDVVRRDGKFVLRDYSTNGTFVGIEGQGEIQIHRDEFALSSSGWIALGQSADVTEEVIRFSCE